MMSPDASSPANPDGNVPTPDAAPNDECTNIAAQSDPMANWQTIQSCLDSKGHALLAPGTFAIARGLSVPASGQLVGPATLILQPGNGGNFMLHFTAASPADAKARIAHLTLNAHNAIDGTANAAIIHMGVDNARIEDCDLGNDAAPRVGHHEAAVYVICNDCTGNEVTGSRLHDTFYGIIFHPPTANAVNVIDSSEIHDTKCDAITFAGYGIATNNHIHEIGSDCENGPIPGAAIYTLDNDAGGVIRGNTMWNSCGHVMDMDRSGHFTIEGNHAYDPGYQWNGAAPWCGGAAAAFLLDMYETTIRGNTFENSNRPQNRPADSNQVMHAVGAARFSDLPQGAEQVIAFVLAKRPTSAAPSGMHNSLSDNNFRASCASGCIGLGYFTSRGTGYDNGNWSAASTNYFTGNNPFGSNVGSRRCGGNWFAASSTCDAGSPAPCNQDDYQHTADWERSDGCYQY